MRWGIPSENSLPWKFNACDSAWQLPEQLAYSESSFIHLNDTKDYKMDFDDTPGVLPGHSQ